MSLLALVAMMAAIPAAFVEKPCVDPAIAPIARCGSVEVPENRARPNGRRIALNLIILKATGKPDLPPVFDIDGGPGLAVTKNAGFYATDGAHYRARREIVMLDQRGTGGSNPLTCPELAAPEGVYRPMLPVEAVRRCRKSLEVKADLRRYLTADAVADLEAVRIALGYGKIDLSGLSYGSTVALRYMATYPDQVRAALLMGVAPPTAMPPALHAPAAEGAFRLLDAQCKADAVCGRAFDPLADLDRALAGLKARKADLAPEIFAEKIRSMMYQPATARNIPWIVHRAAAGDLTPFTAATKPSGPGPFADGMFLSVTCAEGLALMDYDEAARAARRTRFGDYRLRRQRAACEAWPIGDAGKFLGPIKTSAAVLMVSGGLDPVTPPAWADFLAISLPRARHLVIPASGHVFDGLSGIDTCLDPLLVKFLETGDPSAVDPACLATMQPPPFATDR